MAIEESFLGDFSGGEVTAISSVEPQQGQWGLLEGFVLDANRRLRSQWAGVGWRIPLSDQTLIPDGAVGVVDFGVITNRILAVSNDPGAEGWYVAELQTGLVTPDWETLTTPDVDGKLRVAGQMAYKVEDGGDSFWVDALLCNSATELDVDPFAVYVDPRTNQVVVKSWSNYYPTDEGGTADAMPHAGVCTMWGDFLVLGDIVWNRDDTQPLTALNSTRYRHGLWFSIPGKTDTWDRIDTVFTGQKAGANVIQALYPLEPGLMVISCTLVSLLQGSPDDFIYRELREGISNCGRSGSAAWPAKGGVVWSDRNGYVWFSNGEVFQRIDESILLEGTRSVAAVGEYVLVSTNEQTYVFRVYEESGGWTRLGKPSGFRKMIASPSVLVGIEAKDAVGSFILDDEESGELDSSFVLWGAAPIITAYEFENQNRGTFDGRPLRSKIRTRPLPGFGHKTRFWHRFGVRAKGSGRIVSATSRPSSDPSVRGFITRVSGNLQRRFDYIFDAHGPSVEATYDVEFEGDVTVEHMTVWEHNGRVER
jgi:hypothetical protein